MGWRLVEITTGAPIAGTFAMVSPLAITGDEAGQASRSVARKGDFYPNSLKIKRAR
jgi:hypothetical protein